MQHLILLVTMGLLVWSLYREHGRQEVSSAKPAARPQPRVKAPAKAQPKAAPLQFQAKAPVAAAPTVAPPAPRVAAAAAPAAAAAKGDGMRTQLRDRYIAARFPGTVPSAAAFADTEGIVTIARLLFEEDRYDDAQELLQLAISLAPSPRPLELERLEITYLRRDADRYVMLARQFRDANPESREWEDIARLGRALAPGNVLFASGRNADRPHEHYGPWPHTPNWIHASWDLTNEVLATEFHQAMRDERQQGAVS
ncbi:hypothetical protein [Usitatibacter palustris]|uniref:Uncharacterized protein n=1 Tax=Usitatibacter palustris TaxID=2732487 RepID=A0A6M4H9U2_9PROT|nr:hypothetical protein [Usitatibacter palustris]QJR15483.1 hypothetical protein DSM104440_02304 [Usitatibacter palustris]